MNTDIRISTDWPNHPKTKKLIRALGHQGAFALLTLWTFAAKNRSDGALTGMDHEDVALAANWDDDPDTFVSELVRLGWLEEIEGVLCLHDWTDNQPWAAGAEARKRKAKKAAGARWEKSRKQPEAKPADASGNAPSINKQSPNENEQGPSNAPFLSLPYLSLPNQTTPTTTAEKMTFREIVSLHMKSLSLVNVPPILYSDLRKIIATHPRDKIEGAYRATAEAGARSFKYVQKVLEGNPQGDLTDSDFVEELKRMEG